MRLEKRGKSVWKQYGEFSDAYKKGNDRAAVVVGYGERKRRETGITEKWHREFPPAFSEAMKKRR
jgi:hypothetical protein